MQRVSIVVLRVVALVALAASAVLAVEVVHPGRAFCPIDGACTTASESPLGAIGGIPTSVLGLAAFGALLLVSMAPRERARVLLRPAGLLAAMAGTGLLAYQAFALGSFCPLCVVADGAAILAGAVIAFMRPVSNLGAAWLPPEATSAKVAWTLAALLVIVTPFAIPREEAPGWVEITPLSHAELGLDAAPAPADAPTPPPPPPPVASAPEVEPTPEPRDAAPAPRSPMRPPAANELLATAPPAFPPPAPEATPDAPADPEPASGAAASETDTQPVRAAPEPAAEREPASQAAPVTPPPPPGPVRPRITIVEYLNAHCPHCRATHARLEHVLAEFDIEVTRRRVYTWRSRQVPAWARACAYARTLGREEAMFAELMRAPSQRMSAVFAAAERAGVDADGLRAALRQRAVPAMLLRDRTLAQRAHLQRLPTFDIGRRRLMGSQSEAELRAAIEAALRGA